jgi:hypothetical protein
MWASAGLLHDHNRDLLANLCQRSQQSALLFRTYDPQSFVTKFQLMKLQLHAFLRGGVKNPRENIEEERTKPALNCSPASFPLPLLLGNAELIQIA